MFLTHPHHENIAPMAIPPSGSQKWAMVTRTSLSEWLYFTYSVGQDEPTISETRMVFIDDVNEFQKFINRRWSNTSLGDVYLVSPTKDSLTGRIFAWRCDLLLEIKRFAAGHGSRSRYSYQTDFGMRFSEPPDGKWEGGEGELVYKHPELVNKDLLIRERNAEFDIHWAQQAINWACGLFRGDVRAAAQWLHTPLPELGDRAPCDMATDHDHLLLADVVSRLEKPGQT